MELNLKNKPFKYLYTTKEFNYEYGQVNKGNSDTCKRGN